MPQVPVGTDGYDAGPSVFDAPKLEPAHKDEKKRIFIPNPEDLWMEYRHGLGGQSAARSLAPGSPIPGWGGNWLCTGHPDILRESNPHADPANCLQCRLNKEGNPYVDKATRKWVTQIFVYNTDPSGTQLLTPFGVALKVWIFNDREYGQMNEIDKSWKANGGLRAFDLMLTCVSKDFKTWDVALLPQLLWATNGEWQAYVQQAYSQQHIPGSEIELLIGKRPANDNEILAKLNEIAVGATQQAQQPAYYQPPPAQGWPQQPPPAGLVPQQPSYAPPGPGYPAAPAPTLPELAAPPPLAGAPIPPAAALQPPPMQAPPMQPPPVTTQDLGQPAVLQPPPPAPTYAPQPPPMPAAAPPAPLQAPPSALQPPMPGQPAPAAPGALQPPMQPPPMPTAPANVAPAPDGAPPADFGALLGVAAPPPPPAQ